MNGQVYVHALVKGFAPGNRYRVVDGDTVAERGWTASSGMWLLPEADRQICPRPYEIGCGCVVNQRPE